MCYTYTQSKEAVEIQNRFDAVFEASGGYAPGVYNGFQHPHAPVITSKEPNKIQLCQWGLIPHWAKDDSIQHGTLNARIETIHEKPSFRYSVDKRCLVLVDGFYEWQWLDSKGTQKQKYLVSLPGNVLFALAGLWSVWLDKANGKSVQTFTILTTVANELMSTIHNSKKRMPLLVAEGTEKEWLSGQELRMQNERLVAQKVP